MIHLLLVVFASVTVGVGAEEEQCLLAHKAAIGKQLLPSEQSAGHHAWLLAHAKIEKAIRDSYVVLNTSTKEVSAEEGCVVKNATKDVVGMLRDLILLSEKVQDHEQILEKATQDLARTYMAITAARKSYAESKASCDLKSSIKARKVASYVTAMGQSEVTSCLENARSNLGAKMMPLGASQDQAIANIGLASKALLSLELDLVKVKDRMSYVEVDAIYIDSQQQCRNASFVSHLQATLKTMRQLIVSLDECPGRKEFQLKSVLGDAMAIDPADPVLLPRRDRKKIDKVQMQADTNALSKHQPEDSVDLDVMSLLDRGETTSGTSNSEPLQNEGDDQDDEAGVERLFDAIDEIEDTDDPQLAEREEEALKMQEDLAIGASSQATREDTSWEPSPFLEGVLQGTPAKGSSSNASKRVTLLQSISSAVAASSDKATSSRRSSDIEEFNDSNAGRVPDSELRDRADDMGEPDQDEIQVLEDTLSE